MNLDLPAGMTRRHFCRHLAAGAATIPALEFLRHLHANAAQVSRNQKACILMWLGGGPPSIDMWDMKPNAKNNNGGNFKPIDTTGDLQICEHLSKTAQVMDSLSVVRAMSTREADHGRGRYYMHTSFVPNPTVIHPTFGSVVSQQLGSERSELELPAFISIGGDAGSPGFLGMSHAPFVVNRDGKIRNTDVDSSQTGRLQNRLAMLDVIETNLIRSRRGDAPQAHKDVYTKAVNLMTSAQRNAFKFDQEKPATLDGYGRNNFGRGLVMARRLVETGVPFVEVSFGGWDLHRNVFDSLQNRQLPVLDQGISALVGDLKQRGLLDHTVLVCMGEFGRTPRVNQNMGRDHWASSWSVVVGGGGLVGGRAIGATDADGIEVVGPRYSAGDLWATVAQALGIPLTTVFKTKRGRPMKVANGGTPIEQLVG